MSQRRASVSSDASFGHKRREKVRVACLGPAAARRWNREQPAQQRTEEQNVRRSQMSIKTYLRRLRRSAKPAARPRPARPRLGLENLEDRLVLSAVSISGTGSNRVLTYQADAGEKNQLEISHQ